MKTIHKVVKILKGGFQKSPLWSGGISHTRRPIFAAAWKSIFSGGFINHETQNAIMLT
jgi:hypothetical protein